MGVGTTLARRAVALTIALIIVVFLTAIIIGATGYDKMVWQAIITEQVRAYKTALQQRKIPSSELEAKVRAYRQQLEELYGVNKPWYQRVIPLAINTLLLNLGFSNSHDVADVAGIPYPVRVGDAIMACLPRTIVMITVAQAICAAIALLIGPLIAYRHGTLLDRSILSYAALTNALPVWWLGMLFIYLFGFNLGIFPTDYHAVIAYINTFAQNPVHNLLMIMYYAALPIITIVIVFLGSWFYSVRAMVLRVVREDFVMVARAKGLPEKYIVTRHVLRAAAPPVVTSVILSLAGSIGGYIITESVFNWPGMGTLYYAAVTSADVPTILGLTYMLTLVYVIARFILEVLYILLDPRVRL
ncbi:MAG: ABC transporter permease [Thermoprotei archaeon]|nr:MAG: ABC transporter permease [Thermoprotei archaeon]